MTSTHKVEVVPIQLEEHPNADSLSVVKIWNYTCVVRTEDWIGKEKGAYIPPDSIVPETPEFEFLGKHRRIKARRFRGIMSQGLLWPIDNLQAEIGDDVAEQLGITHYEPPIEIKLSGKPVSGPQLHGVPIYDVETWFRYGEVFTEGEPVFITEKIHGTNARFQFNTEYEQMFCGSRKQWKSNEEPNVWWQALKENPWIEEWCRMYPNHTMFGEIYGWVQKLRYGHSQGKISFRAFDCLLPGGAWIDAVFLYHMRKYDIDFSSWNMVPLLEAGPYFKSKIESYLAGEDKHKGNSVLADHIREGVCIRPHKERWDARVGRVHLKAVSPEYLAKCKD